MELLAEERERKDMQHEERYAINFAREEASFIASESKNMRQEEKDMRTFFKKLKMMHIAVRKDVSRTCSQSVISTGMDLVLQHRVAQYRAHMEASRKADLRARKSAKAAKVKRLKALLEDMDPTLVPEEFHVHHDVDFAEDDLDEEKMLRLLVEKEKQKERDRLEALAPQSGSRGAG